MRKSAVVAGLVLLVAFALTSLAWSADTIKIGFNIPMTGDIPKVGEASKDAAEIRLAEINGAGGLKVGDKTYKLQFVYEDNEAKAESAVAAGTQADHPGPGDRNRGSASEQAGDTCRRSLQRQQDSHDLGLVNQSQDYRKQALRFQGMFP